MAQAEGNFQLPCSDFGSFSSTSSEATIFVEPYVVGLPVYCSVGFPVQCIDECNRVDVQPPEEEVGRKRCYDEQRSPLIVSRVANEQPGRKGQPKYKGVSFFRKTGLWQGNIYWRLENDEKGRLIYFGTYLNDMSAAKARDCGLLFLTQWAQSREMVLYNEKEAPYTNYPAAMYSDLLDLLKKESSTHNMEDIRQVTKFLRERLVEYFN